MFNRKKHIAKAPKIDKGYLLDLYFTYRGIPKIPRNLINTFVLQSKNYHQPLELTYLEYYKAKTVWLN